jgi:general secretion pathway protein C
MKRYYTAINLVLITGAVYFCVITFYKISTAQIDYSHPSKAVTQRVVSLKDATHLPLSNYGTIVERNLFNTKTGAIRQPEKIDIESLEHTDLKLKLLGTVTGAKKEAYAVIEDASVRRQNLYRIGDTIQNATLKMILREKVVLHVNDKDEILNIEKVSSSQKDSRKAQRSRKENLRDTTPQNITLERSKIETAVKDVNSLMKQVRIRPHFTNGEPDGLRLTGIRPGSIFYNMGLKSGDILTGVDGKNIVSVDDALKLYQNLQSSSNVQLQLKRRGRPKTLNYSIE